MFELFKRKKSKGKKYDVKDSRDAMQFWKGMINGKTLENLKGLDYVVLAEPTASWAEGFIYTTSSYYRQQPGESDEEFKRKSLYYCRTYRDFGMGTGKTVLSDDKNYIEEIRHYKPDVIYLYAYNAAQGCKYEQNRFTKFLKTIRTEGIECKIIIEIECDTKGIAKIFLDSGADVVFYRNTNKDWAKQFGEVLDSIADEPKYTKETLCSALYVKKDIQNQRKEHSHRSDVLYKGDALGVGFKRMPLRWEKETTYDVDTVYIIEDRMYLFDEIEHRYLEYNNENGTSRYVDIEIVENLKPSFLESVVMYQLMELITAKLQNVIDYDTQEFDGFDTFILNIVKKTKYVSWQLRANAKDIGLSLIESSDRIIFTKEGEYLTLEESVRYMMELEHIRHQYNCSMYAINRPWTHENKKQHYQGQRTNSTEARQEEWEYILLNYNEAFKGKPEKEGFTKDFTEFVLNGGFWNSGKVLRHVLGKNNVYNTYAYEVIENGGREYKLQQAKKGCDYAINNKDVLQAYRFLLYAFQIKENQTRYMIMALRVAECFMRYDMEFQDWFAPYAYNTSINAYLVYKKNKDITYKKIISECGKLYIKFKSPSDEYFCILGLVAEETPMEQEIQELYREACGEIQLSKNSINQFYQNIGCRIRLL